MSFPFDELVFKLDRIHETLKRRKERFEYADDRMLKPCSPTHSKARNWIWNQVWKGILTLHGQWFVLPFFHQMVNVVSLGTWRIWPWRILAQRLVLSTDNILMISNKSKETLVGIFWFFFCIWGLTNSCRQSGSSWWSICLRSIPAPINTRGMGWRWKRTKNRSFNGEPKII